MNLYGMSGASRETGVHESSLRCWEDMGLIAPARVHLGKTSVRIFADEDVDLLKRVRKLIDEGITLRTRSSGQDQTTVRRRSRIVLICFTSLKK